jgi:undecaprenyl-diphosphatase
MNAFDSGIISFLNDFAGHWRAFDEVMVFLSNSPLVKGGPIVAGLWWLWFRRFADGRSRREYVVATVFTAVIAVLVARGLATTLWFRERPMVAASQHFVMPYSFEGSDLESWSSFPSDHAVLFYSLSTGLFLAHRRLGIAAFAWTATVICFPRLYLGIHWPTDLIAGAALGATLAWLGTARVIRDVIRTRLLPWAESAPGFFYAGMSVVMFEVTIVFADGRHALHLVADVARIIF